MRILSTTSFNEHTNPLFIKNNILKFTDVIKANQLLLANQFNGKFLPDNLKNLFRYSSEVHSHLTRTSNLGFFIPSASTTNYGINSLKFQVPSIWNEFIKNHSKYCESSYKSFKKFLNKYFINKYKEEKKINAKI